MSEVIYISEDNYDSEDDYDVKDEIIQDVIAQTPRTKKEVVNAVLEEVRKRKIIMGRYTMAYLIETICKKIKIPIEL
jgi:malonyl CoA-acyl carrier protein transacylase